jgi:hypothetical protein
MALDIDQPLLSPCTDIYYDLTPDLGAIADNDITVQISNDATPIDTYQLQEIDFSSVKWPTQRADFDKNAYYGNIWAHLDTGAKVTVTNLLYILLQLYKLRLLLHHLSLSLILHPPLIPNSAVYKLCLENFWKMTSVSSCIHLLTYPTDLLFRLCPTLNLHLCHHLLIYYLLLLFQILLILGGPPILKDLFAGHNLFPLTIQQLILYCMKHNQFLKMITSIIIF